jgi:carboxyl-terminal processing protease
MSLWKNTKKSDRRLFTWAIICLAMSFMLLAVKDRQLRASAADDEKFLRFIDMAAEVYNEVETRYVDEVEPEVILQGALSGMFSALDEHSIYLNPDTLESINKDTGGEFSGIGIHITMRQGLLTVIAPIPGSPSAKLGIEPWDRIIEIDGETSEGMTLNDAVDKLTGPSGTQVTVKIYREGESDPLEFTITRAQIKIDSVYYHMLDEPGIGYVRLTRFSDNTSVDTRKGLMDMKSEGMNALVIDLRFNTGGLLREAIDVANLFVPKNELIVSTKGRVSSQNREYMSKEDPLFVDMPIFVLVNEGSASASEIVAGALQDHKLAVIIGPKGKNTFGKGSVQTIEPLRHYMTEDEDGNPQEAAMKITTARYYTPSGRTIHHIGVTPDIGIPLPDGHEGDLLRHGLYGDTIIPITKEEKERIEKFKSGELEEEKKAEELENGIEVQTPKPTETPEETSEEESDPFYTGVTKPEFAEEDDFHDVMLDEAVKLIKIYNILDFNRKEKLSFAKVDQ